MTRHSAILTNLFLSLPLATGLLCAAANASAQTTETATIPFTFTADHQHFPAGTYEVRRLPDGLMSLYNLGTGKIQLLMVHQESGRAVETQGRLVFHPRRNWKYLNAGLGRRNDYPHQIERSAQTPADDHEEPTAGGLID